MQAKLPSFPKNPASMAGAVLAAVLIAACSGGAVGAAIASRSPSTAVAAAPAAQPGSLTAIYQQAAPGVVTISTEISGTRTRSFGEATGSGIVVDNQGDVLTNAHVVANARQITVSFSDGKSATGQVSGVDASNDLAVVKVSVGQDKLHPLTLGNSDSVQVGDTALAIGAPFGLSGSLTAGIISGLNRSTTAPNGRALTGMIQTDAPINPGNSGGALLNGQGAVIGINDSIQSPIEGSVGVGFAIPVNTAKRLLPSLEKGLAIQHPWLGISGQAITPGLADSLGLSERSGVLVVEVVSGGPAERAGLTGQGSPSAGDDIITAIDGQAVKTVDALTHYLDSKQVGDKVTLAVTRGTRHLTLSVTLGNFQQQS